MVMAVGRIRCDGVPLPSRPSKRGDEGVAKIKDMTAGLGAHSVIEAVGTQGPQRSRSGTARQETRTMNGETLGVQRWLARWAREPYTYLATNGN
jgi:hypothetical protein